jgi:transcriptional regulator with GAF, ATPase, and Fis domain
MERRISLRNTYDVSDNKCPTLRKYSWRTCIKHSLFIASASIMITWVFSPFLQTNNNIIPWLKITFASLAGLSIVLLISVRYLLLAHAKIQKNYQHLELAIKSSDERIQLHIKRLRALISVGNVMGTKNDLQTIFDSITQICMETFECSRSSLMLFEKDKQELIVQSASGVYTKNIINLHQSIDSGIAGWVARNGKPILLNNPEDKKKYPELEFNNPEINSSIVVPIIIRNELVGVLSISADSADKTYREEDLYTLQIFAQHAGSCIKHAEHVNWLRKINPSVTDRDSTDHHEQEESAMHIKMCAASHYDFTTPGDEKKDD